MFISFVFTHNCRPYRVMKSIIIYRKGNSVKLEVFFFFKYIPGNTAVKLHNENMLWAPIIKKTFCRQRGVVLHHQDATWPPADLKISRGKYGRVMKPSSTWECVNSVESFYCSTPSRCDLAASWPENMGGSWSKVARGNVQIVNNVLYSKLKFSSIYIQLFVILNQLLCCGVSSINHDKM